LAPLVLVALVACTSPSGTPAQSAATRASVHPTREPSAAAIPSADPNTQLDERTIAKWSISGGPDLLTEAFGSIWLFAPDQEVLTVHRIDPEGNDVASVELPGIRCQQFGVSPEGVWACVGGALVRIDPTTNQVAERIEARLASTFARLAYGAGSLWALSTSAVEPDIVLRVDPTDGSTTSIPLGHVAGGMAFGGGALWVTSPAEDLLLRIDPVTESVERWVTGLEGASWVAPAAGALWVGLHGQPDAEVAAGDATLARVDPDTRSVIAEIATGGRTGGLSASADGIWVRAADPFLARIDPATNEVVDTIAAHKGTGDVAVAFGSVWASSYEFNSVWRIATSD
jgi:sugar lactone lactonase YvrE